MKRYGLGKLYDRLTAAERFRLDVLATARGDTRESEHLVATCPRFNYTMNDIGFAGRWQAAKELATITYMSLSCTVEKLRLIEGFGHIVSALAGLANLEAEARADATGEEVDEEDRANAFGYLLGCGPLELIPTLVSGPSGVCLAAPPVGSLFVMPSL